MVRYYTDRYKYRQRNKMSEIITNDAWNGIHQLLKKLIAHNNLAKEFPKTSTVYVGYNIQQEIITCCDETYFTNRLYASIPNMKRVLDNNTGDIYTVVTKSGYVNEDFQTVPPECEPIAESEKLPITYAILDFVEFVYNRIYDVRNELVTIDVTPSELGYTSEPQKIYGLIFLETTIAKNQFREDINEIFYRNDLAYELNENGEINYVLEYQIDLTATSDEPELKKLLETANKKIRSKELLERKLALKELWDAFERIKTITLTKTQIAETNKPENLKQSSIQDLLDSIAVDKSDDFYQIVNKECLILTFIGNNFGIRHSETYQKELNSKRINYLFFRLYSMVVLLLNK